MIYENPMTKGLHIIFLYKIAYFCPLKSSLFFFISKIQSSGERGRI